MRIQINLIIYIIALFFVTAKVSGQTIGLSGPTGTVTSGTIVTFNTIGETVNKYIGSVPIGASTNFDVVIPGLSCILSDSYYYIDTKQPGKFNYILTNTNSVAKTVNLAFTVTIVTKNSNGTLTTNQQIIRSTVTIGPTIPIVTPTDIVDLVTYPERRTLSLISQPPPGIESFTLGIKLPQEKLDLKWTASKLNSSEVYISLCEGEMGGTVITKKRVPNNGIYSFDFSSLNVRFYESRYIVKIETIDGNQFGKSGVFHFIKDHLQPYSEFLPLAYPNAYWIFSPDSSGSYDGLYAFWFPGRINAANVIVDLYDEKGNFFKRLSNSTPNNGSFHYISNDDNVIPRGSQIFYQYKITSIENPAECGYSEVFHWWYD